MSSLDDGWWILEFSKVSPMQRRYLTIDVFTDRMFGGNPVAVVPDAAGLSVSQMQAIAIELAETAQAFGLGAHLHRAARFRSRATRMSGPPSPLQR
jgi:hypothetical protein